MFVANQVLGAELAPQAERVLALGAEKEDFEHGRANQLALLLALRAEVLLYS